MMKMKREYMMMKNLLALLILCAGCLWVSHTWAGTADSALTGWWKCDEGSGTAIHDSGPNAANATLSGSGIWASDSAGAFLNLKTTGGVISIPYKSAIQFQTSNFSMSFWYAPPKIQQGRTRLMYCGSFPKGWWCIDMPDGAVEMQMGYTPDGATSFIPVVPATQLRWNEGRWNHIVICVDRVNSKATFYRNGALEGAYSYDKNMSGSIWPDPTGIGIGGNGAGQAEGGFCDFRTYNRVLTATEAIDLFNAYPRKGMLLSGPDAANRLSPIFTDHMVLQREKKVPIYGEADSGTDITVSFAGQVKTCKAANGKWRVDLDPMAADATSRDLVVTAKDVAQKTGTLTLHDVLVGEIWLAGGQSNMELALQTVLGTTNIPDADYPKIRFFSTAINTRPENPLLGSWVACTPASAAPFSAICFYFAKNLYHDLNVPVGILADYWGGTRIESWMNPETFDDDPEFAYLATAYATGASLTPGDVTEERNKPGTLWKCMLQPVIPFAIRGALWYQGEHNSGVALLYRKLLTSMICDWRKQWGEGQFPFFVVQMPRWIDNNWPVLRDSQWAVSRQVFNTGMVVTIDTGDTGDVHNFSNKEPIGTRLALMARAKVYGENLIYCGPEYAKMDIKGSEAWLSFDHIGGGLKALGGGLPEFEIAGANRAFQPATARIEGNQVVVSSVAITNPVAVRYAWSAAPALSLGSMENFPAGPFSTDTVVKETSQSKAHFGWMLFR